MSGQKRVVADSVLVESRVSSLLRGGRIWLKPANALPAGRLPDRGIEPLLRHAIAGGSCVARTDGPPEFHEAVRRLADRLGIAVRHQSSGSEAISEDDLIVLSPTDPAYRAGVARLAVEVAEQIAPLHLDVLSVPGASLEEAEALRGALESTVLLWASIGSPQLNPANTRAVTAREVLAARRLLKVEDGLRVTDATAAAFAEAILIARSGTPRRPKHVVLVTEHLE